MKQIILTLLLLTLPYTLHAQQSYEFSSLELEMDRIANKYGSNSSEVLKQMEKLLANSPNATPEEKGLFLAYDCSLRAKLTSTLAEERLKDLKNLSINYQDNASIRTATALCEAEIARLHDNDEEYETTIIKAFIFMQDAKLATLRYWIGLNVQYLFGKYQDYQSQEIGLLIGLKVAEDNQDQTRLAAANQLLAETYIATEQYELALKHNKETQKATNNIDDKWYQSEIYTNKAVALTKLGKLDQAIEFYRKSLALTKKLKVYREVQFINLDIAYVLMLKGNNSEAKTLIDDVQKYAKQYDDEFLIYQSLLFTSFQQLTNTSSSSKIQAQINFELSMSYFEKNNYQQSIIDSWLQKAEILKITGNYQESNHAFTQYFSLSKDVFINNNIKAKALIANAYQRIRLDDKAIAEYKLTRATTQKFELAQNRRYFVIGVALLAVILFFILLHFSWRLWKKQQFKKQEINRQRYYDPLTQAYNRRYFDEIICKKLLEDCLSNKTSYLLLIDIDHFKLFNDTYGHTAGDTVLKELVNSLKGDSRLLDSVVRMGGEEFIIILAPDENLRIDAVVERILKLVSNAQIIIEDTPKSITISIGYIPVEKANNNEDIKALVNLADKGLYIAKDSGRNRAIGIKDLQCPANYIDKVLIAQENELLTLTEVVCPT
ncbi:MAG: diguanylate cyclase [Colwellia sp.]|nr:diguanylate cyclase [Colwellia sp.]